MIKSLTLGSGPRSINTFNADKVDGIDIESGVSQLSKTLQLYVSLVHLNINKSKYLSDILKFNDLPFHRIVVDVLTNLLNDEDISHVKRYLPVTSEKLTINILNDGYENLPSPWLMAWVHKRKMWEKFKDQNFTHFMNIEDDLKITRENIHYWLKARPLLHPFGLYPSFFRMEWNKNNGE